MKKIQVRFTRTPKESFEVGTLAEESGRIFFEYAPEWLSRGFNLSPFRLPFEPNLFEHKDLSFGPLPGLFEDSLPDGWGLLLMNRHFQKLRLAASPLDRLAWLGMRTMGALTYHPPSEKVEQKAGPFDLSILATHAQALLAGRAREVLPQLLQAGGSPAGARPKVVVGIQGDKIVSGAQDLPEGFDPWIIKFCAKEDLPDAGTIEYAYSLMARAAGITMPETKLFKTKVASFFGIKRFDRSKNDRYHVHTFGNLVHSNFRIPSCDYADLLRATTLLTKNQKDVQQAFRRMVFNGLAHNRDDHVKNFAFLMDFETGDWSLSPAYDLTFSLGPGGEHQMTIAGEGKNPQAKHFFELGKKAGLSQTIMKTILEEVRSAVVSWKKFAKKAGVSLSATKRISDFFS
ncbi:MAG: type II toxin-antitoxin system HipA family toxin [Deltaproteobacteria bacterium]|nr:type II toxin-antitoxin system HipA family toxin [Deltaproteobacteria bacterium]